MDGKVKWPLTFAKVDEKKESKREKDEGERMKEREREKKVECARPTKEGSLKTFHRKRRAPSNIEEYNVADKAHEQMKMLDRH